MIYITNFNSFPDQNASGVKPKKLKKIELNSQLQAFRILTNDVQMLILFLSYFITTYTSNYYYCSGWNLGSVCPSKTQNLCTLALKSSFTKG